MPKRKTARKRKKVNSKSKKGIYNVLVLGFFVFLSLCFLSGFSAIKFLFKDSAFAFSPLSFSLLETEFPVISYIVVKDINADPIIVDSVEFMIFDKSAKKLVRYKLAGDLTFDIPGKFGNEQLTKVMAIGMLDDPKNVEAGVRVVNDSLFKLFALNPQKYLIADSSIASHLDSFWTSGNYLSFLSKDILIELNNNIKTDLSLKELNGLANFIKYLPSERILSGNFESSFIEDTSSLDEEIADITFESNISKEKKNIAILNGANTSGLASFGARVVTNIGGRVVTVGNANTTHQESILITDDMESQTTSYIARSFGVGKVITKAQAAPQFTETELDRSDMVLIMGLDIVGRIY